MNSASALYMLPIPAKLRWSSSASPMAVCGWARSRASAVGAALDTAKKYARQAHTPETLRAYAHDWAVFSTCCRQAGCAPLPAAPAAIAAYLASLATTHGRSALERRLAAIGLQHRRHGLDWTRATPRSAPH